jgi:hypothetical protein
LSIKEFSREYNSLKQRFNQKQNVKIWDSLNQNTKNKTQFYFSSQKGKQNQQVPEKKPEESAHAPVSANG